MLIRDAIWEKIREAFTEEEKQILNEHITGRIICPAGNMVDSEKLPALLRMKIRIKTDEAMELR